MSDLTEDLLIALFRLTAFQMRLGASAAKAALVSTSGNNSVSDEPAEPIEDEEIDAAARAIALQIMTGKDLGFQSLLRTNFSDAVIREMAVAALKAARDTKA
jgi:hypothetical protein